MPLPDNSSAGGSIRYQQNPLTTGRSGGNDPRYQEGQHPIIQRSMGNKEGQSEDEENSDESDTTSYYSSSEEMESEESSHRKKKF